MSVQTPHARFAQQRPDTAATFLYKSQGLPIHVPVVTKSGTISVRPDQVLNLDCIETDMIVNPQTSPPSGFLNANGTRFQFQLLPSNYCIVHSYMEFDISNTTTAAIQLTPSLFLVDRIRIRNGTSNILQEATGDQIYQELCFNYSQNQLINLQSLTNTSTTTFGSYTTIATGATVTYSIPLSCMFLDQIKFFTGSLGSAGLIVEVLSNGPACVITPAATPASINLEANWVDKNGVKKNAHFNVNEFGHEVAKNLVINKRLEMELSLNHYCHSLLPLSLPSADKCLLSFIGPGLGHSFK